MRAVEGSLGHPLKRRRERKALAWEMARPWEKRLSWQAQGGRVK
jgi:hypothetical protein